MTEDAIQPGQRWTDEFTCSTDPRRLGHVLIIEASDTEVQFRQSSVILVMAREDFERWFSKIRCRCDDIGEGPCPAHTACAICGIHQGAGYYAEDDVTPLCVECAEK